MNDFDNHKQKVELLQLARQQLNEEFLKNKNESHARWKRESEAAWLTNGKLLPYPSDALLYPAEKEVVARALEMYNKKVGENTLAQPTVESPLSTSPWQTYLAPVQEEIKSIPTETSPIAEPPAAEQLPKEDLKDLLTKFLSLARELDAKKDSNNVS